MRCWARARTKPASSSGWKGLQVDLRALPTESYGAGLQYFTGSKEHSVALRARAQKMGLTLNEYAWRESIPKSRWRARPKKRFTKRWGWPGFRRSCARIRARSKRPKPASFPSWWSSAIFAAICTCTPRESDGRATLEEMAEAAQALGYEYVAITDHSKALAMANGLDEKRAVAFAHQVREMDQSGLGLRVFSGVECDIRRDGAMDLEDDALGELDLVIGSVHSYMNLEPAEMTDRLLRALECPHLRVHRPSHRPHAAASRSVSVRLRSGRGGGGAEAMCIWRSTPARSGWI